MTAYDAWKTLPDDVASRDDYDAEDYDDEADYWNWVDNLVDDAREREMERSS